MDLEQLRNLDINDPGGWPLPIKVVTLILVVAGVSAAAWYFHWGGQMGLHERAEAREGELRQEFATKQRRAASLEAYEEQLEEMRETFGNMLRQLPSRAEVAELLVDVSQTGLSSGLEFELFEPQESVQQEFYAELPVAMRVRGDYHQFSNFVSGVANLPRIVTVHDIETTGDEDGNSEDEDGEGKLTMTLTAKTYWYLDEEESDS